VRQFKLINGARVCQVVAVLSIIWGMTFGIIREGIGAVPAFATFLRNDHSPEGRGV
jgi:hypothetical protein